jgi:hypothetical protein
MSRRRVSADEPGCCWEYGWDPARRTFYGELLAGCGEAESTLASYGSQVGGIDSVDALMYLMGVRLPAERVEALLHDRATDSEEIEVPLPSPVARLRAYGADPRHPGRVRVVAPGLRMVPDRVR